MTARSVQFFNIIRKLLIRWQRPEVVTVDFKSLQSALLPTYNCALCTRMRSLTRSPIVHHTFFFFGRVILYGFPGFWEEQTYFLLAKKNNNRSIYTELLRVSFIQERQYTYVFIIFSAVYHGYCRSDIYLQFFLRVFHRQGLKQGLQISYKYELSAEQCGGLWIL